MFFLGSYDDTMMRFGDSDEGQGGNKGMKEKYTRFLVVCLVVVCLLCFRLMI